MGKEVLEDRGRTETERGTLILCGQGRPAQEGTCLGRQTVRSLAGWSRRGGERVAGKCSRCVRLDVRWRVAFRDERNGEAGLGAHRGAGRNWAGRAAASVAPRSPVRAGVWLNRRAAYSQVMVQRRASVGSTGRSAQQRAVAEPPRGPLCAGAHGSP